MNRRRSSGVQTKLVKVELFKLCEKCGEQVYVKLWDLHGEECGGGRRLSIGKRMTMSPPRSIPETSYSTVFPSAFDEIMSTPQVTISDHFHLHYEGLAQGRHRWSYSFEPVSNASWVSKSQYLRINPTDPSCICLTLSTNLTPAGSVPTVRKLAGFPRAMMLSILQKNIRRQRREETIHTSMQIIANLGLWELARRLCVINIEETVLHPDYPVLAWSMATCREFIAPPCLFESILQIAADIASIPVRDPPTFSSEGTCFSQWVSSPPLGKCLLLRAFYRGMESDIAMLRAAAQTWNQRLSRNTGVMDGVRRLFEGIGSVREEEMGGMRTRDIPLAAIDGGVSTAVDRLLRDGEVRRKCREGKRMEEKEMLDYLSRTCWDLRSGLNLRRSLAQVPSVPLSDCLPASIPPTDPFFSSVIEPKLDHIAREIIAECYANSGL